MFVISNNFVGGGGVSGYELKSTTFSAVAGGLYLCDTTSAAFTATLPAAPAVGDKIEFLDARNTWDTNNLTLGRNSLKIASLSEDLICNVEGACLQLVYQGTNEGWRVSSF